MTAFLDWIDRGKQSKASPNLSEVRSVSQAYADAALRNAVRQIHEAVEGERNHTLNAVAYSIRPLIASGLLDEQFVADELAGAARMIGLGAIEIDRTIQSGFDGSDADPRPQYVLEEPQTPSLVSSIQPPPENAPEAPWKPGNDDVWGDLPPVDGADWLFAEDETPVTLWGEDDDILWAEGEALMIVGGMGLGKTTLAGMLVRGLLGLENSVLDLPVLKQDKPILYLAMDRPRQIRRSFRRQFKEFNRDKIEGRLIVRPGPPIMDIAICPPLLARMADEVGAGVVFVDSLKDAVVGLSEDATAAAYNRARQALLARGINICELHHTRKTTKDSSGGIDEVFGSTWLASGAGSVIILSGQPGDPVVKFRHAKQPALEVGPFQLNHDSEIGELTVVPVKIHDLFIEAGADGVTAKAAAIRLYDSFAPSDAETKRAARHLDKLVKRKFLIKVEGQRGGFHDGSKGSQPAVWFLNPKTPEFIP